MKTTVSAKGQVTIPKVLRDKLGITPGTVLEFEAAGGQLVARKRLTEDVLAKWRGRGQLPSGMRVDAYLRRARDADGD
jgi:AbrB family looped-hinge helix DNA binding protein